LLQCCHRSGNDQEKKIPGQEKVREFCFESGKIVVLKKSQGKLKQFNTVDLIPLKAGRHVLDQCDLNDTFKAWTNDKCLATKHH